MGYIPTRTVSDGSTNEHSRLHVPGKEQDRNRKGKDIHLGKVATHARTGTRTYRDGRIKNS